MKFDTVLIEGKFIKRYKGFFADIAVAGENIGQESGQETIVTVHVPNTGSMMGCSAPNSRCFISKSKNPERKLQYTLEMVESDNVLVGVNTSYPNRFANEAFEQKILAHWRPYDTCQTEVKVSKESRIDLVLKQSNNSQSISPNANKNTNQSEIKQHFVEIKNVTLKKNGVALFPDAVSSRGLKHIKELVALIQQGHTAEFLFVVQRGDCQAFSPAFDIDPDYSKALAQAKKEGLIVTAVDCLVTPQEIRIHPNRILPVEF